MFVGGKKPKARRRRTEPLALEATPRPPWQQSIDYAPLTGRAEPPAIAFHRKLEKPWEPSESEAWWRTPRDDLATDRARELDNLARTPKSERRKTQIRDADVFNRIDAFDKGLLHSHRDPSAGSGNENSNGYISEFSYRQPPQGGWMTSQAWSENLRHYPNQKEAEEQGESVVALSGRTHSVRNVPSHHLESDVRKRTGGALADPAWRPEQVHMTWAPNMVRKSMQQQLDRTVDKMLKSERAPKMRNSTGAVAGYVPPPPRAAQRAAAAATASASSAKASSKPALRKPSKGSRRGAPLEVRL